MSGRAGRAEKPGEVFIQTSHPENPVIRSAADAAFAEFAEAELADRREAGLPPYSRFATILFRSQSETQARNWAELYSKSLAKYPGLSVSEAIPPALERAEGWFRYQVQVRSDSAGTVAAAWQWIAAARPLPKDVRAAVDIDAVNVM